MQKDILFYSRYCRYSKEIIDKLQNTPLMEMLNFVNVDDSRIEIPPFITHVPTALLISESKVLKEDELNNWINSKLNNTKKFNNNLSKKIAEIMPYCEGDNCQRIDGTEEPFVTFDELFNNITSDTLDPKKMRDNSKKTDIEKKLEELQLSRK